MKVVATNIGKSVTINWHGQAVQTGIYKYEVDEPIFLGTEDVKNDEVLDRRYHGGADKACYLYSSDHYEFWKRKYPDSDWRWGMFGENLTVSGLDESEICIGDTFQLGEALVQVSQPRQPCFKLGVRFENQQIVHDFWHNLFPGIYVRVIQSGMVKTNDEFILLNRDPESLPVSEVFSFFRIQPDKAERIRRAIQLESLADSCRKDLMKLLK